MQLAFAAQMRELDRKTIEETGIPGMVLMENAGRGTVDRMQKHFGPVRDKAVCVFAGPGNNGGDGLVIARTVHGLGGHPLVLFPFDPEQLHGDAALNFNLLRKLGLPFQVLDALSGEEELARLIPELGRRHAIHCLVDALFGTGLARPMEEPFLRIINGINFLKEQYHLPVVSADIPSGLDSDTGRVLGAAVRADLTVTYGLAKPGHFHHGGTGTGILECIDIGIPPRTVAEAGLAGSSLDRETEALLLPRRAASHKGTNGHLLILAGAEGKTGAALLCGQGALRGGAGLVTLAAPHRLQPVFATALAEAMSVSLPASGTFLTVDDYEKIQEISAGKTALVIGPGIGLEETTARLVLRLYTKNPLPQVLDADALTILARHPGCIAQAAGPRIFTPHPGEMARLLGTGIDAVQADRLQASLWMTREETKAGPPLITVLKGAGTVVAASSGRWAINTTGNPGMGTGGTGDVLAGLTGGLLAQGYAPWEAVCLGVYLHGLAADLLARSRPWGYTASDIALMLPETIGACLSQQHKECIC